MERLKFGAIWVVLTVLSMSFSGLMAQEQDSTAYEQLRMMNLKNYNDIYQYWFKSDRNFTTGQVIEIFHPSLGNKVANALLLGYWNSPYKDYSLAIEQDIYTPTNLESPLVDTNDRPYAGLMYLDYAKYSNNFFKGKHMESHFILGWIGKEAFGREMQNGIHTMFNNSLANGWSNQLASGLIIDYDFAYRQLLPMSNRYTEFTYVVRIHGGTLKNYAEVGGKMKLGHFGDGFVNHQGVYNHHNAERNFFTEENFSETNGVTRRMVPKRIRKLSVADQVAFLNARQHRRFQFYMQLQLKSAYTVYDGTAEGSLISFNDSPYTRMSDDQGKWIFTASYGLHLQVDRLYLEFNRFLENDVYSISSYFGYGQVLFGWVF